jgi:hypothetical protein
MVGVDAILLMPDLEADRAIASQDGMRLRCIPKTDSLGILEGMLRIDELKIPGKT